jgi:4-amino-4-deoxy-L-arabinose transferase-like glycosyltransferase
VRPNRASGVAALLACAAFLFLINVSGHDLWPPDEPRFAQVAREMIQSGNYLSMQVNNQPYDEKPPLLFWAIAAVSLPAGDVTELTARLPSVAAALLTVLCTYVLAQQLFGGQIAFWSALILLTMARFWWEARSVRTDMLFTACLCAALLAFWLWHKERRARWWLLFYGAIAAAVYAKGPPGLIFPGLLVVAFYWRQKKERQSFHWFLGLALVLAFVSLWFIPASIRSVPSEGSTAHNLFRQTIGRFFLGVSKAQWPWYYVKVLPIDWLPWSFFLPWTVLWVWRRRRERPEIRLLLSWTIPAFVFFSICIGKRAVYLLPLYPAAAILFAHSITDLAASGHATWRRRTALAWGVSLIFVGLAPFGILLTPYRASWSEGLLAFSAFAIVLGIHTLSWAKRTLARRPHTFMAGHFVALAALSALFIVPAVNPYKSAREFCAPLRTLSEAGMDYRLYSLAFSREEYVYYSKHFHEPVVTQLLGLPGLEGAEQQRQIRKAIMRAAERVPINSFQAVTAQEVEALAEAIQSAVSARDMPAGQVRAYQHALGDTVQAFAKEFAAPSPVFLFVQEEDWRWILPFAADLRHGHVIRDEPVGSRTVLLIANKAGAELLGQVERP